MEKIACSVKLLSNNMRLKMRLRLNWKINSRRKLLDK
jgi:hypothetical protein